MIGNITFSLDNGRQNSDCSFVVKRRYNIRIIYNIFLVGRIAREAVNKIDPLVDEKMYTKRVHISIVVERVFFLI